MSEPTGWITRDSLSLDDLQLWEPGAPPADPTTPRFALTLDGLQPGGVVKRRQISESAYVDDAFQVQSSRARVPAAFNFFVSGYDHDSLQANTAEILAAIDQKHWRIHINMPGSGGSYGWACWDADVIPGFAVPTWYGVYLTLAVSTLRSPYPVDGPI